MLLAGVMIFSTTACGGPKNAEEGDSSAVTEENSGTHVIVDHLGYEVEVPYEIDRIAVGGILPLPSVLAVFFDSADKIVGMAPNSMSAAKNGLLGELYPEILEAQTSYINGSEVNLEELMNLEPDVVFYNASQKEQGEQLRNAGVEMGFVQADVRIPLPIAHDGGLRLVVRHVAVFHEAVVQRRADEAVQRRLVRDLVPQLLGGIGHAAPYALPRVGNGAVKIKETVFVFQSIHIHSTTNIAFL